MKTLAFHNQKGGVGKTTLAGNVSFACAERKKTVLIDGDPQGNLSSWLLETSFHYELADVLTDKVPLEEALVPLKDELWILGTFGIDGQLLRFVDHGGFGEKPFIFVDLRDKLRAFGAELVIYDLSPGMRVLEKYALVSTDEVICPLTPEFFGLDGVEAFGKSIEDLNRDYRCNIRHRVIVENMVNRSFRRHLVIHDELEKLDYKLHVIPQDSRIGESQIYHQSIFQYDETARAVLPLRDLAAAVMEENNGA